MGGTGTPESWAKPLAATLSKIRTRHKMSRAVLASRMLECLPPDEPEGGPLHVSCSHKVIQAIEEARRVKISRELLDLICNGLRCTPAERFDIFMSADRNVFADATGKVSYDDQRLLQNLMVMRDNPSVHLQLTSLFDGLFAACATEHDLLNMLRKIQERASELAIEQARTKTTSITIGKKR